MAKFEVSASLERILIGAGIAKLEAEQAAAQFAQDFPDVAKFEEQFMAWVSAKALDTLTPEHLTELASIIVRDFAAGIFTPDPQAFGGAV